MKLVSIFLLIFALNIQPFFVSHAEADASSLFNRLVGCVARLRKAYLVDPYVANYEGQKLVLSFAKEKSKEVQLGKRLGSGVSGTVYEILQPGIEVESTKVLKMTHRKKGEAFAVAKGKKDESLVSEYSQYKAVIDQGETVWSDGAVRAHADIWDENRLPIVPIHEMIESNQGIFLVKEKAKGLFLSDIVKKYGSNWKDLPEEMRAGLRAIYDLGQAVHRKVKLPSERNPIFSLDMKPENILWVNDPKLMQEIGLKKPGFAFFEFSHHNAEKWLYDESRMSFESYQAVFSDYLKSNK